MIQLISYALVLVLSTLTLNASDEPTFPFTQDAYGFYSDLSILDFIKEKRRLNPEYDAGTPTPELTDIMDHNWRTAVDYLGEQSRGGEDHVEWTPEQRDDFYGLGLFVMNALKAEKTHSNFRDYYISGKLLSMAVKSFYNARFESFVQRQKDRLLPHIKKMLCPESDRGITYLSDHYLYKMYDHAQLNPHFILPVFGPNGEGSLEAMIQGRAFYDAHGQAVMMTVRAVGLNRFLFYDKSAYKGQTDAWDHDAQHDLTGAVYVSSLEQVMASCLMRNDVAAILMRLDEVLSGDERLERLLNLFKWEFFHENQHFSYKRESVLRSLNEVDHNSKKLIITHFRESSEVYIAQQRLSILEHFGFDVSEDAFIGAGLKNREVKWELYSDIVDEAGNKLRDEALEAWMVEKAELLNLARLYSVYYRQAAEEVLKVLEDSEEVERPEDFDINRFTTWIFPSAVVPG